MPTEADTCRTLITPKLQASGWENDPHSIAEQRYFTDGRIIVHGNRATRRAGKRADYINSMVEFKQIIGRGTRVRDDYGKLWFNILDYTGAATAKFAGPAFDGDPAFATQEEIDESGQTKSTEIETPEEPASVEPVADRIADDPLSASIGERDGVPASPKPGEGGRCRKFYYDGGQVEIAADLVYELDADGKQLRGSS